MVHKFKYIFSVFKQYYTYFHILFYLYIFSKKLKTVDLTYVPHGTKKSSKWSIICKSIEIPTQNSILYIWSTGYSFTHHSDFDHCLTCFNFQTHFLLCFAKKSSKAWNNSKGNLGSRNSLFQNAMTYG